MMEMHFYVIKTKDGLYHVQNVVTTDVGIFFGQHHVHTEEGFKKWARNVKEENIHFLGEGECNCGLRAGDVREYDGREWHSKELE